MVLVAACTAGHPTKHEAGSRLLVVVPDPGVPMACPEAALPPFRLSIDLAAASPVWGVEVATGRRFAIEWPPGFTLRETPEVGVLDSFDNVVGRDGTLISDAGGSYGDPAFICEIGTTRYPLNPSG